MSRRTSATPGNKGDIARGRPVEDRDVRLLERVVLVAGADLHALGFGERLRERIGVRAGDAPSQRHGAARFDDVDLQHPWSVVGHRLEAVGAARGRSAGHFVPHISICRPLCSSAFGSALGAGRSGVGTLSRMRIASFARAS